MMKELLSILALMFITSVSLQAQIDCIKGNCKNGYGTCIFPSGSKYIGEFKNGKINGKGILYFSDGSKYIGHWVNQYREGEGRMVFPNGDEYLGMFKQNKFKGQGVMTFINGNHYEGEWAENKPNGEGTFQFANGDIYEGLFNNGQCEGNGVMNYSDGSQYVGEWAQNKRHGQGEMRYADGETVTGRWENGEYLADWSTLAFNGDTSMLRNCNLEHCASGMGKFNYRDGSKYVGDFHNGTPEGNGTIFYAAGGRYEGGWKQHAPHGKGVMYYANGKVVGAIWDFGKPLKKLFERQESQSNTPISVDFDPQVKIWAVIIGAARYPHMPVLRYTDDDAYQVYAFLKSPEGGALPDSQVKLLIDEEATHNNIMNAMRSVYLKADGNDVIMFYFSGHGLQGAFLPVDYDGYNNRLEHSEIKEFLNASKAKHKLVLADACHSGSLLAQRAPISAVLQKYYTAFEQSHGGTALLMSSRGEEYSLEDGGLRSGIFSHFLVRGLKGEADIDRNKIISIEELFSYVHQNVRKYTGNVQTPTLTGDFDSRMPVGVIR